MFARVITARTTGSGFDDLVRAAERELPGARERPGFAGYQLLTDDATGTALIVSLWATREDLEAVAAGTAEGVHEDSVPASGLTDLHLATYEVRVLA
jgi:heme-degrading monooxygenase HmoA